MFHSIFFNYKAVSNVCVCVLCCLSGHIQCLSNYKPTIDVNDSVSCVQLSTLKFSVNVSIVQSQWTLMLLLLRHSLNA